MFLYVFFIIIIYDALKKLIPDNPFSTNSDPFIGHDKTTYYIILYSNVITITHNMPVFPMFPL